MDVCKCIVSVRHEDMRRVGSLIKGLVIEKEGVRNRSSNYLCKKCKKKHSLLLCYQNESNCVGTTVEGADSSDQNELGNQNRNALNVHAPAFQAKTQNETFTAATGTNSGKNVILSTAFVFIETNDGTLIKGKALCDSGSVSCFCTTELADILNLKREKTNISVCSISGISTTIKQKTVALICNQEKTYKRRLEVLVIPKIAGLTPAKFIDVSNLMIAEKGNLANRKFYKPEKVNLLLGAEVFYDMLRSGQIYVPHTGLILQNSVFGYIVSGNINDSRRINLSYYGLINDNSESELKMFFELESLGSKDDPYCHEEDKALEIFNETVCFKAGRYEVTLPWKRDWSELADNYRVAENRLKALVKRMNYDKTLFST
ncbi:hypothetical protein X975_03930, partial [Stegodyphus mimosarum]